MKPATRLTFIVLNLIALLHALRLVFELPVTVAGVAIPSWPSFVGAIVFALLAAGVWREHTGARAS
jgi:hypothetical protein